MRTTICTYLCIVISATVFSQMENSTKIVGEQILLEFSAKQNATYRLFCSNSYASTFLEPTTNNKKVQFKIPKSFTLKRGIFYYQLLENKKSIKTGKITLLSAKNAAKLESYIGPPSIEAGGEDFSMLVVIPTDRLDNPLQNYTIEFKNLFKNTIEKSTLEKQDVFSYKNYYSPNLEGKMAISSSINPKSSKELELKIMPRVPSNFQIYEDREHNYADGNQLVTFKTSTIVDEFGNLVNDGTFVYFHIQTSTGKNLFINGLTINGVATAKIVHPDIEQDWTVNAFVTRISKSNSIQLKFKNAVSNFNFTATKNNRKITVGPIESYMQQLIPDGYKVILKVKEKNRLVKEFVGKSSNGFVHFELNKNLVKAGSYDIEVNCGGMIKPFTDIHIKNE